QQHVDFFQTFSPTPKMTTLRVLLHVAAQRDYELHSLDFSTAFLQGSLHEEILLRRPPGFTRSFLASTQWSLQWPVYGLRQAPHEWHDTLRTTLAALGFAPSTAYPSLFLRTDTSLPPFHILVYIDNLDFAIADTEARALVLQRFGFRFSSPQSTPLPSGHLLSAPPSDESVEPSGPYPLLMGCLMYLMTCTRPDLAYPLSILARYVAHGRHQPEQWEAAKRVLRCFCSTSGMGLVLGGQGPVFLTGQADASWLLRPPHSVLPSTPLLSPLHLSPPPPPLHTAISAAVERGRVKGGTGCWSVTLATPTSPPLPWQKLREGRRRGGEALSAAGAGASGGAGVGSGAGIGSGVGVGSGAGAASAAVERGRVKGGTGCWSVTLATPTSPPLPWQKLREGRRRGGEALSAAGAGASGGAGVGSGAGIGSGVGVGSGAGAGAGCRCWHWRWRQSQALALALTTGRATGVTGATRRGRNRHDGQSAGRRRDGTGRRIGHDRAERDEHDGPGPVGALGATGDENFVSHFALQRGWAHVPRKRIGPKTVVALNTMSKA
ncbi:unnamed protein product, partial [Closterium sp. NIES-53]